MITFDIESKVDMERECNVLRCTIEKVAKFTHEYFSKTRYVASMHRNDGKNQQNSWSAN